MRHFESVYQLTPTFANGYSYYKLLTALVIMLLFNEMTINGQDLESINNELTKIIEKHNVPGIAYCIVTPEYTHSAGIGRIGISDSKEVSRNTRFRVGSITKSFIAIGLLKLQEEGVVSLDNYLKDIIPEIHIDNKWEKSPISIRHLLEHTSGLGELTFNEIYSDEKNLSSQEIIDRTPSALKVLIEPGSYFQYSNSGYLLAGYILEKYTKQPFEKYLKEQVLTPLGMNNSTFRPYYLTGNQPIHYLYQGNKIVKSDFKEIMNRWAGSLSTTSDDMSKFIKFLINRDEISGVLSKKSFKEFETPVTSIAAKNGIKTGYALGVMKNTFLKQTILGNRGGTHDLHARYNYLPSKNAGFYFSMNISNGACGRELNQYLSKIVFPDNSPKTVIKNHTLSDKRLNEIEGFYQSKTSRMKILTGVDRLISGLKVFKVNDSLFVKENGGLTRAVFSKDGEKFAAADSNIEHILIGQKNGHKYLVETNNRGGFYYKTSYLGFRLRQVLVFGAIILSILTGLFFLLKIIVSGIKRNVDFVKKYWIYVALPILLVTLLLIPISVDRHEIEKLGSLNSTTITLFLISILYPLLTALCALKTFIVLKKRIKLKYKVITWLNFGSAIVITGFMFAYGYFSLVLW